jgi:LPS sulfotransferase NodH
MVSDYEVADASDGLPPLLSVFTASEVHRIRAQIGAVSSAPWPAIEGCLVVLFTARSGSTFLTRELEIAYDIGHVGESLNPPKLQKRPAQRIVDKLGSSWFAFKAGLPGVISAESCGLLDAYRSRTSFIRLVRRDILAQAVSTAKAVQTRAWHARNAPVREPEYDGALISKSINRIARGVEQLRQYAQSTGRPCLTLVYEDFADGDLTAALAVGDALGLPRRLSPADFAPRPVERVGDAVNEAWISRFAEDMTPAVRNRVKHYVASIEGR